MLRGILRWFKPLLGAAILLAVLQSTGFMSSMRPMKNPEPFDFNFTLRSLKGERIPFERYKGKVIFLNLWATWCGPCRAEMPTIQSLYEKIDTTAVKFVILSIDRDRDEAKVGAYINQMKYTFPVYRPSGYLTSQLNVDYIPTTFIINKEGKVVSKEIGGTNFDTAKFKKFLLSLTQ